MIETRRSMRALELCTSSSAGWDIEDGLLFEIGRWIFKNMIPKHKVVVAVCRFTEDVDVHSVDAHNLRCSPKIGLDALNV